IARDLVPVPLEVLDRAALKIRHRDEPVSAHEARDARALGDRGIGPPDDVGQAHGVGPPSLGTRHLSPCIPSCAGLFKRSCHTPAVRGWCTALLHANLAGEPRVKDIGIDIVPLETVVRATPRMPLAEEWATVMAASGIAHRLALTADGWAVVV